MRRLIAIIPAALLAALATACSSSTDATRSRRSDVAAIATVVPARTSRTTTGSSITSSTSQPNLQAMLLRLDEMPADYTQAPNSTNAAADVFCDAARHSLQRATASVEVSYQRSDLGPFVTNDVGTFGNVDALFASLNKSTDACRTYTETRADGVTTHGSFERIDFPNLADRTFAARFTGEGDGVPFVGTLVVVARGSRASTVTIISSRGASTAATQRLESYVRAVSSRLA